MSPKEYIHKWFQSNKDKLEVKLIQYSFHDYSGTHFIYVEPDLENLNKNSLNLLSDLIFSFESRFMNDQIGIIDSKSITQLQHPHTIINNNISVVNTYYSDFNLPISERYLTRLTFNEAVIPYSYSNFEYPHDFLKIFASQFVLKHLKSDIIVTPSIFFELVEPIVQQKEEEVKADLIYSQLAA